MNAQRRFLILSSLTIPQTRVDSQCSLMKRMTIITISNGLFYDFWKNSAAPHHLSAVDFQPSPTVPRFAKGLRKDHHHTPENPHLNRRDPSGTFSTHQRMKQNRDTAKQAAIKDHRIWDLGLQGHSTVSLRIALPVLTFQHRPAAAAGW